MKILNSIVKLGLIPRANKILHYMKDPMSVQHPWFEKLIQQARDTEWGKKYGFASIKTIQDFQERVPINDYDDLKPYIHRMMMGESDILWKGKVRFFSKSSGTTSDKSKYIPVPHENLTQCHHNASYDTLSMWYNSNPQTQLFSHGKGVVMGGSLQAFDQFPETTIGDVSAIILNNLPFYAKYFHTPSMKVALMSEWESKIDIMAEQISKENITNIGGVPTWTIVLFRKILEITGKSNILEVFPNFELYLHGGVSFLPYKEQFKKFLPSDRIQYRDIYNASEGFFAAQVHQDEEGMLLLLNNAVFYEFLPMSELGNPNAQALTIEEVDMNTNYAILISTNAGLWRYLIGDTVKFVSLYPHRIKITGRTKHFINVFGEEVIVDNTDKALAEACKATGALVCEYTVGPIFLTENNGGHEWLIEFEKEPDSLENFRDILDQSLQNINSDYEAKRYKSMALDKLVLHTIPTGTFHEWMKSRGKYGGQNKVPRLFNTREYLEGIQQFINKS